MSLIAWYPLNGDLYNRTNNKVARHTNLAATDIAANYVEGKIGLGLKVSNSHIIIDNPFIGLNEWSMSLWFMDTGSSDWADIFTFSYENDRQRLEIHDANKDWTWYNYGTTYSKLFTTGSGIRTDATTNKWYNIIIIFDNGVFKLYCNNKLLKSESGARTFTSDGIDKIYFGSRITGAVASGIYNDIKLYSHALCQKEITELYQCCIVNYNFDDEYAESTTNVLPPEYQNREVIDQADAGGYVIATTNITQSPYTLSGWYVRYPEDKTSHVRFSIEFSYSDGTSSHLNNHICVDGTDLYTTADGLPHYFTLTHTPDSSKTVTGVRGWILDRDGYSGAKRHVKIINGQLEAKDHATPYVSGTRSNGLIRDISGYSNYGIVVGNMASLSNDTNTHNKSLFINNVADKLATNLTYFRGTVNTQITTCSEFTISFDAKITIHSTINGLIGFDKANNASEYLSSFMTAYDDYLIFRAIDNSNVSIKITDFIILNEWHHYTITYDGSNLIWYRDGIEIDSVLWEAKTLCPGKYVILSYSRAGGVERKTAGYWSEFKMYMTAMTPEMVYNNYINKMSLDKNGNLYTGTLNINKYNIKNIGFNKTKVINTKFLNEIYTDNNGIRWLKILHHNNKSGTNLFSSTDDFANSFIYHNDECWSAFHMVANNKIDNKYEFLIKQENGTDIILSRWTQTNNPATSTSAGTVTNITTNISNSGLVKCSGNTFLAVSTSTSNWWQACGCYTIYNNGIPGFNSQTVTGILELYVRVDNVEMKISKSGQLIPINIVEG